MKPVFHCLAALEKNAGTCERLENVDGCVLLLVTLTFPQPVPVSV
jgi:hypothetical protein